MRRCLILLSCLLLAACAGDRGDDEIGSPVTTGFLAEAENVIEVEVTAERPAASAELVAPGGQVYPAYQILRDRVIEERGGLSPNFGVGIGVFGGSKTRVGTSVGIGIPLGGFGGGPPEPEVTSRARIRVPDMAAYRSGWRDWTVRIRLGDDDAEPRLMEVPAPSPPQAGA